MPESYTRAHSLTVVARKSFLSRARKQAVACATTCKIVEILLTLAGSLFFQALAQTAPPCARCHPAETARYLESPMGRSLGPPTPRPAAVVNHTRSGSIINIEQRGAAMVHRLTERGLTAEYPIAYQIGAGKLAHSYAVEIDGYLFESPVTWFRSGGWDVSPGYARARAVDFDRPINETCLFCHAGAVGFSGADGRKLASPAIAAITCERCHGPSEDHIRHPSKSNIVNPARLEQRARDSVCEQCHLEGVARVLNPGKTWRDFQPGGNFEQTAAVYVFEQREPEFRPVSQIEQLASSRCALASGGKLWCGSCHQAHAAQTDRSREIRQVCTSCHAVLSVAEHPKQAVECVSCHMPQVATEYTHVAVTDHRILRRARTRANGSEASSQTLIAWVDPPPEFRQRDLTLADLAVGHRLGLPAVRLAGLKALPNDADAALLAAACEALLDQGPPQRALEYCRRAAEQAPESADRAMSLGTALSRSGDFGEAERQLRNAIRLDPSLKHAYVELWALYDSRNQTRQMAETADRFLNWNPLNIMFRVLKASLPATPK
jgi:hypothetical protein